MDKKRLLRFRDWRILTKLLIVMLVLSWVPLSVAMALNVESRASASRAKMENYVLRLVSGTARETQRRVMQDISDSHDVIRETAGNPDVVAFLSASPSERDQLQRSVNGFLFLMDIVSSSTIIGNVSLLDQEGISIANTDPSFLRHDQSRFDHVKAALSGERFTGGIHIAPVHDTPGFFISAPIAHAPRSSA